MRLCLIILLTFITITNTSAQRPRYEKLSPMLRKMVHHERIAKVLHNKENRKVCAFVKVKDGGEAVLQQNGCRVLLQEGDICIANIPQSKLSELSRNSCIVRIEANRSKELLTDTIGSIFKINNIHEGLQPLTQAFTGRGVVVGVMDVGFDLTHPTFYSRDLSDYRIRSFWDMLSADTIGSPLPVGRSYEGREVLLALAHARDGLEQTHGTHTAGIAAGSGYNSPYIGMAPESDICLVANAVTQDTIFIDPDDYDKYTFATDALGFKYIFDYAERVGKPCVINFSEGSRQDFWGNDQLYYEMLERISGPGRIIVSSAGNNGNDKTWFSKPVGTSSAGTFLRHYNNNGLVTTKGRGNYQVRLVAYEDNQRDTLIVSTSDITTLEDSLYNGRIGTTNDSITVSIVAYPSCYNTDELCLDINLAGSREIGSNPRISLELLGDEADVECYRMDGNFTTSDFNTALNAGEKNHSILSPSSAPSVICVGATAYRQSILNYKGERKISDNGTDGILTKFSAIGPTFDGRLKPDILAPGANIISSYSSYYLENHPTAGDISWDVQHFDFNGRTYAWNSNSGTSMSAPVVAGIIALWLEACPTLTANDVMGIFERTCNHYDSSLNYPNNLYGYGEINAYKGLLDILGISKIEEISNYQTKASVSITAEGLLQVRLPQAASVDTYIKVYSLKGYQLISGKIAAGHDSVQLPLPSQPRGIIFAVQIEGDYHSKGSMLVRNR